MTEYETGDVEAFRRGGLAWTGLLFLSVIVAGMGPVQKYFWVLLLLTFPLAVLFLHYSYSVRRLWVFTLTLYPLAGIGLLLTSNWLADQPRHVTANFLVNATLYYGILLVAGATAYVLTYRGGYGLVKNVVRR